MNRQHKVRGHVGLLFDSDWYYLGDRVSIHYQHREISASDKVKFTNELTKLAEPGNIEFFAG